MTSIVGRCAAGIGAVLAPFGLMAVVTVAAPAVSWADCAAGEWWDPMANTCRPPVVPPPPMCDNGWWWDPVGNACRPPLIPPG